MKHDSDTILRHAIMRDLTVAAIAAGWPTDRMERDVPRLAAAIFGPLPIIDSKLALDIDKALNSSGASPEATGKAAGDARDPIPQAPAATTSHETATAPTPVAQAGGVTAPHAAKAPPAAKFVFNAVSKPKEAPHQDDTSERDGGAKASIADSLGTPPVPASGPVIEITSPQFNVLEALCQMADKGNTSPTISQIALRSGEPSVPYQLKGLIEAKCIKNSGRPFDPIYTILRRFDDPNVRRRPMQARYTKPTGIMTE